MIDVVACHQNRLYIIIYHQILCQEIRYIQISSSNIANISVTKNKYQQKPIVAKTYGDWAILQVARRLEAQNAWEVGSGCLSVVKNHISKRGLGHVQNPCDDQFVGYATQIYPVDIGIDGIRSGKFILNQPQKAGFEHCSNELTSKSRDLKRRQNGNIMHISPLISINSYVMTRILIIIYHLVMTNIAKNHHF